MSHIKPTDPKKIVCTRCGGHLQIEMRDEGSAYHSYRVVDSIYCSYCGAEWDPDFKPQESK